MKIVNEKYIGYKYSFEFDFSYEVLSFCRSLREKVGNKNFIFYNGKWRFNDINIAKNIKDQYRDIELDADVTLYLNNLDLVYAEEKKRISKILEIKDKKDSSITIDGLKKPLYGYQRVGVEFMDITGGRTILADQMGCLSGNTIIQVNKGGNCRKYSLRDAYLRFNDLDKRYIWELPSYMRSYDEEKKQFTLNKVKEIILTGKKHTVEIKAKNKSKTYKLQLTLNHEIMTPDKGWVRTKKLKIGDEILCNPDIAEVISIKDIGVQEVYDVVMEDPHRSFIANGIVVHNSGKSVQALAYCLYKGMKKILVICPASVKYVWEIETKKWTDLKSFVFDGKCNNKNIMEMMDIVNKNNVFIINYDLLKKFQSLLQMVKFECCIMDEFHYIKSGASKRAKVAKLISRNIKSIILLSGTPLLNRPIEMFNGLNLIDPTKWNDWFKFASRYCGGHQGFFGYEAKGATNIEELKYKISPYFIRREKKDILKELPPKQYIHVPIELSSVKMKEYNTTIKEFKKSFKELDNPVSILAHLSRLRQQTTDAKEPIVEEMIQDIISSGEKVIVFSCYNRILESLHDKFNGESVLLIGKTKEEDRRSAIDRFQNDDKIKVFLGGIKSAGVGITLTAASNVIFIDFDWIPASHAQAEDRAHRPSAEYERLKIHQIYAIDTIDEYMKEILEEKKIIFDKLMSPLPFIGGDSFDQNLVNEVVKRILKK